MKERRVSIRRNPLVGKERGGLMVPEGRFEEIFEGLYEGKMDENEEGETVGRKTGVPPYSESASCTLAPLKSKKEGREKTHEGKDGSER